MHALSWQFLTEYGLEGRVEVQSLWFSVLGRQRERALIRTLDLFLAQLQSRSCCIPICDVAAVETAFAN